MREVSVKELAINPFTLIGEEWGLVTAGSKETFNTMTVSWGGMGVLWGKNVVFVFIRPQRYTYEFIESSEYFTLSFFPEGFKPVLSLCGSKSGRDIDKVKETGLTPLFTDNAVYFEQSRLVFVCRKLAEAPMDPNGFIDQTINNNYVKGDYHRMFAAEIVKVYAAD